MSDNQSDELNILKYDVLAPLYEQTDLIDKQEGADVNKLLQTNTEPLSEPIIEVPDDLDVDANDDGYVDNVTFLVNGSPDGWAELLWPHRWSLYLYDAYINGALVDGYNVNLSSGGYYTVCLLYTSPSPRD